MTKSELKELIHECIDERLNNSINSITEDTELELVIGFTEFANICIEEGKGIINYIDNELLNGYVTESSSEKVQRAIRKFVDFIRFKFIPFFKTELPRKISEIYNKYIKKKDYTGYTLDDDVECKDYPDIERYDEVIASQLKILNINTDEYDKKSIVNIGAYEDYHKFKSGANTKYCLNEIWKIIEKLEKYRNDILKAANEINKNYNNKEIPIDRITNMLGAATTIINTYNKDIVKCTTCIANIIKNSSKK